MATPNARGGRETATGASTSAPLIVGGARVVINTINKMESRVQLRSWRPRSMTTAGGHRTFRVECPDAILHISAAVVNDADPSPAPLVTLSLSPADGNEGAGAGPASFVRCNNGAALIGNVSYEAVGAASVAGSPVYVALRFAESEKRQQKKKGERKKDDRKEEEDEERKKKKEARLRVECGGEAATILLTVNTHLKGEKAADPGHRANADELAVVARANASLHNVAVAKPGQVEAGAARMARNLIALIDSAVEAGGPGAAAFFPFHLQGIQLPPGFRSFMFNDPSKPLTYYVTCLPHLPASGAANADGASSSAAPAVEPATPRGPPASAKPASSGRGAGKRSRSSPAEAEGDEADKENRARSARRAAAVPATASHSSSGRPAAAAEGPRKSARVLFHGHAPGAAPPAATPAAPAPDDFFPAPCSQFR
eukprot:tig00000545_g2019.t1